MPDGFIVSGDCLHRAEEMCLPAGKKQELVEEIESRSGWLVYACDDDELDDLISDALLRMTRDKKSSHCSSSQHS